MDTKYDEEEFLKLSTKEQVEVLRGLMNDCMSGMREHADEAKELAKKIVKVAHGANVQATVMASLSVAMILARQTGLGDVGLLKTLELMCLSTDEAS